jgi:hypothetical protein
MSTYIHREILLFFGAAGMGAALALGYDLLVVLRAVFPHSGRTRALEDLFYWTMTGLLLFWSAYRSNEGNLRFYLVPALLTGAFVVHGTLGPLFVKTLTKLIAVPLFFVRKKIKRLLFYGKRCRISMYKFAQVCFSTNLQKTETGKRAKQVEKSKKRQKKKKNRV